MLSCFCVLARVRDCVRETFGLRGTSPSTFLRIVKGAAVVFAAAYVAAENGALDVTPRLGRMFSRIGIVAAGVRFRADLFFSPFTSVFFRPPPVLVGFTAAPP